VVILGALIALLGFPANIVVEIVKARVPAKYLEMNLLAFEAGYHSLATAENL
jgi:Pyruvate/2-oxoacid:ferredoxin oxidoreductase gamma subunit